MIYLASASPRRRELLAQLGLACEIVPADIDESRRPGEAATDYVLRLARAKAEAASERLGGVDQTILAADTAVIVADQILGKPADLAAGRHMLGLLAGRMHEVYTGVAALCQGRCATVLSRSEVRFRAISAQEIDAYWATGEPADKAGGYAIQGLGAIFVAELRGSYSGVMGLPLFETAELLGDFGCQVLGTRM